MAFRNNNGFFNRFYQSNQGPAGQNVPRGTFQQNPQNVPRGTFPQNMPNMPNYPPQMQQMPQMPQMQQMPPTNLLNPKNDPHVRFEAVPEGLAANLSTGQSDAPQVGPMPKKEQGKVNEASITGFSNFVQGESNSVIFYENLAKSRGVSERNRRWIHELMENKKRQIRYASVLYKSLADEDWTARDMDAERVADFRGGVSYALIQESRMLREVLRVYDDLHDGPYQKGMATVLNSKIADIAHLIALRI